MHSCRRDSHATSRTAIYANITQTGRIWVYCSWFWVVLVGFLGFVGDFGWFWVVLGRFGWFRVLVTTRKKNLNPEAKMSTKKKERTLCHPPEGGHVGTSSGHESR